MVSLKLTLNFSGLKLGILNCSQYIQCAVLVLLPFDDLQDHVFITSHQHDCHMTVTSNYVIQHSWLTLVLLIS